MLTCMHKMPTCHMHTHANMHTIYQHAISTCNMPLCRQNMYARKACTLQPPGAGQRSKFMVEPTRRFPSFFKVAEKPSPLGNKYKGQTDGRSRALGYVASHIKVVHTGLNVSKDCVQKQIGKSYVYSCSFLQTWSHCTYIYSCINGLAWPISLTD